MNKKPHLLIAASVLIAGCAFMPKQTSGKQAFINPYPTRDKIEYVLNCIAKHGGLSGSKAYVNQYACGCKIDKIAEKLTFTEYEKGKTFSYLKQTPGEKGAVFRSDLAKESVEQLEKANKFAESKCFFN